MRGERIYLRRVKLNNIQMIRIRRIFEKVIFHSAIFLEILNWNGNLVNSEERSIWIENWNNVYSPWQLTMWIPWKNIKWDIDGNIGKHYKLRIQNKFCGCHKVLSNAKVWRIIDFKIRNIWIDIDLIWRIVCF